MPPPYDTVISIGGQSFIEGLWRIFGPTLQGLTNPLPIALPGFEKTTMRIANLFPIFPGSPPPGGGLQVRAAIEVTGEPLLTVNTGTVRILPVPVDLTASKPIFVDAVLTLSASGIDMSTRSSIVIRVQDVSVSSVFIDPALAMNLPSMLEDGVKRVAGHLGIPNTVLQPPIPPGTVPAILTQLPLVIERTLKAILSKLIGETGRLIYPQPGPGASCDVQVLPTIGDLNLAVAPGNTYVLQLGFGRASSSDITSFPPVASVGNADTTVSIGNAFLLELLCCLIQRLPAFTLPVAPVFQGGQPSICCSFTDATVDFGLFSLTGNVSICINGSSGSSKTITITGAFKHNIFAVLPFDRFANVMNIEVGFTLPVTFDVDNVASLANIRVLGSPIVSALWVGIGLPLVALILIAGVLLFSPAIAVVALAVVSAAYGIIQHCLGRDFVRCCAKPPWSPRLPLFPRECLNPSGNSCRWRLTSTT